MRRDLQETLGLNDSRTYLCASRAEAMRQIERIVAQEIHDKKIENNREAKRKLCMKVLRRYESRSGEKDEYLGAKLFRARKLASKFSA